jgi:hypothetical protein
VYGAWGFTRAHRQRRHSHLHVHANGTAHSHEHAHESEHLHVHASPDGVQQSTVRRATPWVLFTIFLFGPCEPLIPLLMFPAARHSAAGVAWVTAVFGLATLATMAAAVLVCLTGVEKIRLGLLERYSHALAGGALALCGCAIQFMGL